MKYFLLIFINLIICNETLTYKVKYNNIKAGNAVFKESILENDSIKYKQISFSVKSNKFVDIFYKLRNNVSMITSANEYYIYDLKRDLKEGKKIEKSRSIINYNSQTILYDNKNIIFDGEKVYSILSLIYFLRIQTLKVDQEYFINIYNNGKIKPAIVRVEQEYNNQEEENNKEVTTFFIITVQSQDNNKNHMQLVIAQIDNKKIPIQIELNTKNGIMELSIDD
tara:strand:+ start:4417 stop:5088 length:672 start_codon:yes stop_codon:yes gene_type:complete